MFNNWPAMRQFQRDFKFGGSLWNDLIWLRCDNSASIILECNGTTIS